MDVRFKKPVKKLEAESEEIQAEAENKMSDWFQEWNASRGGLRRGDSEVSLFGFFCTIFFMFNT